MGTDKHWGVLKNTPGVLLHFENSSEEHLVMNNVTYLPGIVSPVQPIAEVATSKAVLSLFQRKLAQRRYWYTARQRGVARAVIKAHLRNNSRISARLSAEFRSSRVA